jgi:hypothetical protein
MKFQTALLALVAATLMACAQTTPQWESRFGDATRQLGAQQVLDPAAPSRNTALTRTDGKASSGAIKRYVDSFGHAVKDSTKQPEMVIHVPGYDH